MLFNRVLVPIDLSEVSADQLECALQLKRYGMEELVLLYVLSLEGGIPPDDEIALNNLLNKATSSGVKARTVVEKGKVSNKILEVAKREENENKLIVVILPDTGERYLSTWLFKEG